MRVVAMLSPSPVQEPSPAAEQLANELSHDLMSPYCPGRTIATCPSPQARKLEGEILVMAEDGMSRQQIESELVSRFPDIQGYLGRPELIYGTALAALIAITMLLIAARRWTRRTAPAQAPSAKVPPPDASEMDRLDDALDRIEGF